MVEPHNIKMLIDVMTTLRSIRHDTNFGYVEDECTNAARLVESLIKKMMADESED